jgi:hypothetical protein
MICDNDNESPNNMKKKILEIEKILYICFSTYRLMMIKISYNVLLFVSPSKTIKILCTLQRF